MQQKIIGLVGLIGSGKGTVADYLVNKHKFRNISFANHLKDAVSAVFSWPRNLLEGDTEYSRQWRDEVDEWWSERLNIPNLTPRWVLQYLGTDVLRKNFHDDIWIASLEYQLLGEAQTNFVISDVRFPNEIEMIKKLGGEIWHVQRGKMPEWADIEYQDFQDLKRHMTLYHKDVHASEWSWILNKPDVLIKNNTALNDLYQCIEQCLKT
jgi:hypothetical protein